MFERIESKSDGLGDKPCVEDTRISMAIVLKLVADGAFRADTLGDFPHLTAGGMGQTIGVQSRGKL